MIGPSRFVYWLLTCSEIFHKKSGFWFANRLSRIKAQVVEAHGKVPFIIDVIIKLRKSKIEFQDIFC